MMQRLNLKRQLGKIWPANINHRKIILLYHSVGTTPWGMREPVFSEQMNWLHDHCRILSLAQLIEAKPSGDIQVALTFDDGYQTLYDHVAPVLSAKKMDATVNINFSIII